jgi:Fe-S cluster assembly protein SufD
VITATAQLGTYLESFTEFQKRAAGGNLPWLRQLRENAFARFCEVGFPTTHDEDWRFTNVSPIARTPFELAKECKLSARELEPFYTPGAACQLAFVNGRFIPELSSAHLLPDGITVNGLAREMDSKSGVLESHCGRYLNIQRDAFSALNTAFAEDGAYVHVPKGVVLDGPIYLLFISTASDRPMMTHPRNLVIVEDEAQATILEDYVSVGESTAFCNTATELVVGESATVSHYMIEREHRQAFNVSTLRIQQERSANVSSHSVLLGGGLVRNNVHPVLAGAGGECLINGLFMGSGRQHLDNYMLVEHASPHCGSRQFYNGILDDRAHGVFHGRIVVHKDAQKTDAKQTNRNLLLSDNAQIDTKPQLEIYADDVKCTHGATIGQIEENALFYLRSRGIDEVSARKLLLLAFASECLDRMHPGAAREHVERLIHQHLFELAISGNQEDALSRISAPHSFSKPPEPVRNWKEIG